MDFWFFVGFLFFTTDLADLSQKKADYLVFELMWEFTPYSEKLTSLWDNQSYLSSLLLNIYM